MSSISRRGFIGAAGCGPQGAQTYDFERHGSLFGYADDLIDILDEERGVRS